MAQQPSRSSDLSASWFALVRIRFELVGYSNFAIYGIGPRHKTRSFQSYLVRLATRGSSKVRECQATAEYRCLKSSGLVLTVAPSCHSGRSSAQTVAAGS